MFFDFLDGINRMLAALNINMKYLNRLYILFSLIPMGYVYFLIYKYYINSNYIMFSLFLLASILILYFWSMNFLFYFFNKNTRLDITQLLANFLPNEIFEEESYQSTQLNSNNIEFKEIVITDYDLLNKTILTLIKNKEIKTININEISNKFEIPLHTILPFYKLDEIDKNKFKVSIKSNFDNHFNEIGFVNIDDNMKLMGVFVYGGKSNINGVIFEEKYRIKVALKKRD